MCIRDRSKAGGHASLTVRGKTLCGTPNYFSPEMVDGKPYGAPSDAWAVGLLAHEILTLRHPFMGGSLAAMLRQIVEGSYNRQYLRDAPYPDELKAVASAEQLLHVDPSKRLTLDELLARLSKPTFAIE